MNPRTVQARRKVNLFTRYIDALLADGWYRNQEIDRLQSRIDWTCRRLERNLSELRRML